MLHILNKLSAIKIDIEKNSKGLCLKTITNELDLLKKTVTIQ